MPWSVIQTAVAKKFVTSSKLRLARRDAVKRRDSGYVLNATDSIAQMKGIHSNFAFVESGAIGGASNKPADIAHQLYGNLID
jgi:hypothetical protein